MQDFIFYKRLTGGCLLDWSDMAGGRTRRCLRHDG